ncbi:unnamed protein product [Brassica napus]|uniref:(rape) hypothetical protein n=1 Tax=Brassica napus TaxID=3708 RepID=A0A816MM16_BRANA|nr:unnamed protein product [Brassica napus]
MEKKSNGESDVNGKWDACIDLTARRVVCSSLGGAFAGLLFFSSVFSTPFLQMRFFLANSVLTCFRFESSRFESDTSFDSIINFHAGSPVTRWASTAFGAGIGIGSAYADCSRFFDSSSSATSPSIGSAYADCSCLFCFTPLTVCGNPYCIGFLDHFLSSHFLENNIGS